MLHSERLTVVITTIQPETHCVRKLASIVDQHSGRLIVVGDLKGPHSYKLPATEFLAYREQLHLPFATAVETPPNNYARKNIGYLRAMAQRATTIYETDDDNSPNHRWRSRELEVDVDEVSQAGWVNVYRLFTDEHIWPRGFPLDQIHVKQSSSPVRRTATRSVQAPIQQGLANGSPDVDAIWRMVQDQEIAFRGDRSVQLLPGAWCPFNSQSTWWWPDAFPLMYLPSTCSFRMTDIWRSLIAQRCLWAFGEGVVFHGPEVNQQRNPHDLVADFRSEIEGYLHNRCIVSILERLTLDSARSFDAICCNLWKCHEALVTAGHLDPFELDLVNAWLADITAIRRANATSTSIAA